MRRKATSVISLWSLIEAMQRGLEREGFSTEVVDAMVTRGIESLLSWVSPPSAPGGGLRPVARA